MLSLDLEQIITVLSSFVLDLLKQTLKEGLDVIRLFSHEINHDHLGKGVVSQKFSHLASLLDDVL